MRKAALRCNEQLKWKITISLMYPLLPWNVQIWTEIKSGMLYLPESKASREVANLTERKKICIWYQRICPSLGA